MNIKKVLVILFVFVLPKNVLATHNVTAEGRVYFKVDGRKVFIPGVAVQRFDIHSENKDGIFPVSVTDENGKYAFSHTYTLIEGKKYWCAAELAQARKDNFRIGTSCKMGKLGTKIADLSCNFTPEQITNVCGFTCGENAQQRWFAYFPKDFLKNNIQLPAGYYVDSQDMKGGGSFQAVLNKEKGSKTYCVPNEFGNTYHCNRLYLETEPVMQVEITKIEEIGYEEGEAFLAHTYKNAGARGDMDFEWIPPKVEKLECSGIGCNDVSKECSAGLSCIDDKCVNPNCIQEGDCVCNETLSCMELGCEDENKNCGEGLICNKGICVNIDCPYDSNCNCDYSCENLSPEEETFRRGEKKTFVCKSKESGFARFARFKISSENGYEEFSDFLGLNSEKKAFWEYQIPIEMAKGKYKLECQICLTKNLCTKF